jgi:3-phenylpropionate/trans-cinnamate dioxygenase ferredoxin reductase subunit
VVKATESADVVIVGAGHAGVQLAVSLSKSANAPSVLLIGDEPLLPYERPPLTKRLLHDDPDAGPVFLRSAEYWQKSSVVLRTGEAVVAVVPDEFVVITDGGVRIGYRTLVWAAGGRSATSGLPGEQLRGVHAIRSFADLTALRSDLAQARTVVVVGGGYLGLEAAAGFRQLGLAVTVVELAPRLLARVTGTALSEFFEGMHRSHGTTLRRGERVERILDLDGRAVGVRLRDGTDLPADVVVVGVGMRPNVGPLLEAGAGGDHAGIDVDAHCRTSLPDVYAIGDCARQLNPWSASGTPIRVESVHNASQHAATAVREIVGLPPVDQVAPWFWSTQYGHELKTVGLPAPDDEQVVRGDPSSGEFSVVYLRDGVMAAIDTINRPRDFARAQALVTARWRPAERGALVDVDEELPRLPVTGSV